MNFTDTGKEQRMIRVSVEVENGNSNFTVTVQAKSIERALNAVRGVYSTTEAKVLFPLDPESFFVEGGVETVGRERVGAAL